MSPLKSLMLSIKLRLDEMGVSCGRMLGKEDVIKDELIGRYNLEDWFRINHSYKEFNLIFMIKHVY